MKYQITQQSKDLLKEWNAEIVEMLNASYALASERCTQLAEQFNGHIYSRIHRKNDGVTLLLEERVKGQMYPVCYLLKQDFSEIETALREGFPANVEGSKEFNEASKTLN